MKEQYFCPRVVKEHLQKIMAGKLDSKRHKLFVDPRHVLLILSWLKRLNVHGYSFLPVFRILYFWASQIRYNL